MAEFCEVMKQAHRMCEAHDNSCAGCPLASEAHECRLELGGYDELPEYWNLSKLPEIERIVMDWAAEHPEPRYPTWREWHKANFPNVECGKLCPAMFGGYPEGGCINATCEGCLDRPIPADIAEKLGIKPIGGTNDENDYD